MRMMRIRSNYSMMQPFILQTLHDHHSQAHQFAEYLHPLATNEALSGLFDDLPLQINALRDSGLTILFTGELYSGKRMIINALLEETILPDYPHSLQHVPTVLYGGEEPEAYIHYVPRSRYVTRPPTRLKLTGLGKAAFEAFVRQVRADDEFECIELHYPHPYLAMNLTIVDFPCRDTTHLSSTQADDFQKMVRYLKLADAVVYVRASDLPPSRDEDLLIECMQRIGHRSLFFICNQVGHASSNSHSQIRRDINKRLGRFTSAGEQNIFFTYNWTMRSGQLHHQPEELMQAGLADAAFALFSFLKQCSQQRLRQEQANLKGVISTAIQLLEQRQEALQEASKQQDHRALRTFLYGYEGMTTLSERHEHMIISKLARRNQFHQKFKAIMRDHYDRLQTKMALWVAQYQTEPAEQTAMRGYSYTGSPRERFVKEFCTFLAEQIRKEAHESLLNNGYPLFKEEIYAITTQTKHVLKQFLSLQNHCWRILRGTDDGQTGGDADASVDAMLRQVFQERYVNEKAHAIITTLEQTLNAAWPTNMQVARMLNFIEERMADQAFCQGDEQSLKRFISMCYTTQMQNLFSRRENLIFSWVTTMLEAMEEDFKKQLRQLENSLHSTLSEQIKARHYDRDQIQEAIERLQQDIRALWIMYDEIDG